MEKDFYRAFEDRYRGSRNLIKSRLRVYLPFVEKLKTINTTLMALDLGCGRGEWLEILQQEAGFNAYGVDLDEGMLKFCSALDLSFANQDILECLKETPDESQLIVSAFHVAEHLPFEQLLLLIREALRVLKPCGLLILETPNPENLVVGCNTFYLDPTHQRPLPSALLAYLPEYYGYKRIKILRLQESPELVTAETLQLMDVIGGVSPDYAIIAQKDGPAEFFERFNPEFEKEYGLDLQTLAKRYEIENKAEAAAFFDELEKQSAYFKAAIMAVKIHLKKQSARVQHIELDLETKLERQNSELALLKNKIEEVDHRSRHWRTIAEEAQRLTNAIQASKSWRITLPLRIVAKKSLWLKNQLRSLLVLAANKDKFIYSKSNTKKYIKRIYDELERRK